MLQGLVKEGQMLNYILFHSILVEWVWAIVPPNRYSRHSRRLLFNILPHCIKGTSLSRDPWRSTSFSMSHVGSQHTETAARCCLVMESKNSNRQRTPILCRLRHSASSSLCDWPSAQTLRTNITHMYIHTDTAIDRDMLVSHSLEETRGMQNLSNVGISVNISRIRHHSGASKASSMCGQNENSNVENLHATAMGNNSLNKPNGRKHHSVLDKHQV